MKPIGTEFETGEHIDNKTGSNANRETEDIDRGLHFVLPQFTYRNKPVTLYHKKNSLIMDPCAVNPWTTPDSH